MDEQQVRANLNAVVAQIREYVPSMAPYFEIGTPLGEYSTRLGQDRVDPVHASRHQVIARAVRRVLRQAFGPRARISIDTDDVRALNIVDHHQLLNHPALLGTNIIANAARLLGGDSRRPIVTLSCSNVPPSNCYMRNGFQFRGETVPYFTNKEYRDVMYYAKSRPFAFAERLRALRRWNRFSPADQEFLERYQTLLNGLDYAHTGGHRDQLAVAVRGTWPLLFAPPLREHVPELLYANSEDVTRECLTELLDEENFLTAALFDPTFRRHVLDTFRGTVVAWDEAAGKGTHFFWRKYPGRPKLLRMYLDGPDLVPADPRFSELRVPLEPAAIRDHLNREEIIPSVALNVSLLLYAGVKPLLGPGSLAYTTRLREGWMTLLRTHRLAAEAELIQRVDTRGLIAGAPIFFGRDGDTVSTLYAADVFAMGGVPESYLKTVLDAPLKDVLAVGSSEIYDLFSSSYIPQEKQLAVRVGAAEAAAAVHQWL